MSARKTKTARVLLAITGVAALSAAAWAQPRDTIGNHGDPAYGEPAEFGSRHFVGSITVDGQHRDLDDREGVRAGVIDALRCAGYEVWTEGQTIVVNTCNGRPRIRLDSREYRLSVRDDHDGLHLTLRPRHRHQEEVGAIEPPIARRDRYRIEPPAIIFDEPGHGGGDRGRGGRERDRNDRPGNRREYDGERRAGGPREYGGREPGRYETEYFGIGIGIDGDDNVSFDLDTGFVRGSAGRTRWQ